MMRFKSASITDVELIKKNAKILLITATNVETSAIHSLLRPLKRRGRCLKISTGTQTYYVGKLGCYGVIHVQCQMGSVSPGASATTVAAAIAFWDLKAIVMVGIAFGVDRTKQNVGDVLISKTVIPYEVRREGKKIVQRGAIPPCGPILLNRFTNSRQWKHELQNQHKAKALPIEMLSGEALIDNVHYRTKLLDTFPQAEGGEMEGVGVFAAAHQKGIEWILIKAICDFADGKKAINKKLNQTIAAESAASLCNYVFSQREALNDLSCPDLTEEKGKNTPKNITEHAVFFEVYETSFEDAYLKRKIDSHIESIVNHQGMWVTGPSGCGKTNALMRNLLKSGKSFEFIDLSRCVDETVPQLFAEICSEINLRFNIPTTKNKNRQIGNGQSFYIGEIARLIYEEVAPRNRALIIDEIPLEDSSFQAFSQGIAALTITLANRGMQNTPIYLASKIDPAHGLKSFLTKFRQRIHILRLSNWTDSELTKLLALITKLLPMSLSPGEKIKLINGANGCPRSLKSMLKTWRMFRTNPEWSLERVISENKCI